MAASREALQNLIAGNDQYRSQCLDWWKSGTDQDKRNLFEFMCKVEQGARQRRNYPAFIMILLAQLAFGELLEAEWREQEDEEGET